jgi:hypothetical protein
MVDAPNGSTAAYEAPALVDIGAFHELTLDQDKKYGASDGFTFMGASITNASS